MLAICSVLIGADAAGGVASFAEIRKRLKGLAVVVNRYFGGFEDETGDENCDRCYQ